MDPAQTGAALSLLERRLVIVTGKGGTGKTTVAAALALGASQAGLRVLLAEMGPDEQIPRLLDPSGPTVGYEGRELAPDLTVMRIEPFAALGEYLGLQLGVPAIVAAVLRNQAFQQLMTAAPGWRELITLGKIWHLAQREDERGRPRYDYIVVDAPATGHGISFLEAPRVVVSAVRAGPLRVQTQRVEALLKDPARTLVLPVTLAEELPVRETTELIDRVGRELGIEVDRVVVNGLTPAPFDGGLDHLDRTLAALDPGLDLGRLPAPRTLAACARYWRSRHELNRHYTEEISRGTGLPLVLLPRLPAGIRGQKDLSTLAGALLSSAGPAGEPLP